MTATTSDPIDGFLLNNGMAINPKIFERAKKDLEAMIALARLEGALEELENQLPNFIGNTYYANPTEKMKERITDLENQIKGMEE